MAHTHHPKTQLDFLDLENFLVKVWGGGGGVWHARPPPTTTPKLNSTFLYLEKWLFIPGICDDILLLPVGNYSFAIIFPLPKLTLTKEISSISDDTMVIWLETNMSPVCDTNKVSGFFLQNYSNNTCNRQYVSNVSTLWSQNTTLTSSGCYWWYIPTECIKSRGMETKNYFLCFQ